MNAKFPLQLLHDLHGAATLLPDAEPLLDGRVPDGVGGQHEMVVV